jgi:hypothetical protein
VAKTFKSETKDFIKSLNEKAKVVSYFSIGVIDEHLVDGHIRFAIDRKDTLIARVNYWEYYDNDHWKFFGDLIGKNTGDVHINVDSTGVYGFINYGDRTFEILSTNVKGTAILIEHFRSHFKCPTVQIEKLNSEEISLSPRSSNSCDLSKIRVIVVYTASALSRVSNNLSTITNRVNNGINIFNNANVVSGVTEPKAELELAGIVSTSYIEPYLNSMAPDNQNTYNTNYFNPLKNALRNTKIFHQADVLVLLTGYTAWNSTHGVANAVGASSDDMAYAMVQIEYPYADRVFAHEVGHIISGEHSHGHEYDYKLCTSCPALQRRFTIMRGGVPDVTETPALRWSNPNINDGALPTGVNNTQNNALRINNYAPIVAGFRENPSSANAVLTGPTNIYNMGTYSYSIFAGCPTPIGYTWEKSTNGTSWTWAGNGTSISQFFYPGYANTFYVRCTISHANGANTIRFFTTHVNMNQYRAIEDILPEETINIVKPNPVFEELNLEIKQTIKNITDVTLTNEYGIKIDFFYQIVRNRDGKIYIQSDISTIKNGKYHISISDGKNIYTSQFIKL